MNRQDPDTSEVKLTTSILSAAFFPGFIILIIIPVVIMDNSWIKLLNLILWFNLPMFIAGFLLDKDSGILRQSKARIPLLFTIFAPLFIVAITAGFMYGFLYGALMAGAYVYLLYKCVAGGGYI